MLVSRWMCGRDIFCFLWQGWEYHRVKHNNDYVYRMVPVNMSQDRSTKLQCVKCDVPKRELQMQLLKAVHKIQRINNLQGIHLNQIFEKNPQFGLWSLL